MGFFFCHVLVVHLSLLTLSLRGPGARQPGCNETHLWSQTRTTVTLYVIVPAHTKAKAVAVTVEERHVAVSVLTAVVLDEELAYPVVAGEEDLEACWEVWRASVGGVANHFHFVRITHSKKFVSFLECMVVCAWREICSAISSLVVVWWLSGDCLVVEHIAYAITPQKTCKGKICTKK